MTKPSTPATAPTWLVQCIDALDTGVLVFDAKFRLVAANRRLAELFDFSPALMRPGTGLADLYRFKAERGEYGAGDHDEQVRIRMEIARRFEPYRLERERPGGMILEERGMPLDAGGFVTIYTDLTELRQRERAQPSLTAETRARASAGSAEADRSASEKRFHDFALASSDWFFETDAQLRYCYFSPRFLEITGLPPERVMGKSRDDLTTADEMKVDPQKWAQHHDDLTQHRPFRDFQYALRSGSGVAMHISVSGVPAFDADGGFIGYRGTGTDITELHRVREAVQHMAQHDPLTELPNRRYFETTLNAALARSVRYRHGGAVVLLDLDHFKLVNDRHGHQAGDQLLQAVAAAMLSRLRKTDFLARVGGDEFALIFDRVDSDADPLELATKLIERVTQTGVALYPDCELGVSAGVALFDSKGPSASVLLQRADAAMYAAKAAGRGRAHAALD